MARVRLESAERTAQLLDSLGAAAVVGQELHAHLRAVSQALVGMVAQAEGAEVAEP